MALRPGAADQVGDVVRVFPRCQPIYAGVGGGVPDWWLHAMFYREASLDFGCRLEDGARLAGSQTWLDAARSILREQGLWDQSGWTIGAGLDRAERWNGLGYRMRGLPSPYLWAGTTAYASGLFVDDGRFQPGAVDHRIGVAPIWRGLIDAGLATIAE